MGTGLLDWGVCPAQMACVSCGTLSPVPPLRPQPAQQAASVLEGLFVKATKAQGLGPQEQADWRAALQGWDLSLPKALAAVGGRA